MDPNQFPRYPHPHPHAHNSDYLAFDPDGGDEQLTQHLNVWSYHYIPTSGDVNLTTSPSFLWQDHSQFSFAPPLSSNADGAHQPYLHYQLPSPSAGAYHASTSDPYYLTSQTAIPYGYHASPHLSAYPSPVSRSMSVSAVSNTSIDPVNSNQRPQPQAQATSTFLPTPRQIRFVSTDGQPHAKRRRINAACLTCRKRKTRCSGEHPICKTCSNNGHRCAGYAEKTQRKGSEKSHGNGNDDDDNDDDSPPPGGPKDRHGPTACRDSMKPDQTTGRYHARQSEATHTQTRYTTREHLYNETCSMSNHTAGSSGVALGRTGVPYFRYFGPTAIAPGLKQMVVQMKDGRELQSNQPPAGAGPPYAIDDNEQVELARHSPPIYSELPYYDAAGSAPNPPLITDLCEIFFVNLECNYPFLQRTGFLKDLQKKRVDAILVNAVCAVSARFSEDLSLTRPSDESLPLDGDGNVMRAFRGQPFAQRAMSAVINMFACPTLAVTQACLLLAYEEFGSDRDSGLWMYLGISIRMAQDLGIQKLEGLQLEGRLGATPKTAKNGSAGKEEEKRRAEQQNQLYELFDERGDALYDDRKASEQERIDTFWSIFFLDRAVSSGVGRPVTLRDKDIEISFPYRSYEQQPQQYPNPYPAMIRIVHMYGRVADVINNIKDTIQVTPDVLERLAAMEKDLTGIYQKLFSTLHFDATNFQFHVKAGQGTSFILLHLWFHALIVLLHQPTLLHSLEGRNQQLFPNSRELSMSSAKTITDILAFAEFIDVKSFIGSPFTSQPIYIAACAFLAEMAIHSSQPSSRSDSPPDNHLQYTEANVSCKENDAEQKVAAKHSLLASAAKQNYKRCYKALRTLESYWAGCRYILTALDQRSAGLADPLLFSAEDVDEMPCTEPSFTSPGWRKSSFGISLARPALGKFRRSRSHSAMWSPKLSYGNAIGWSITGTANSPAPSLSFLYQKPVNAAESVQGMRAQQTPFNVQQSQNKSQLHEGTSVQGHRHGDAQNYDSSPLIRPPRLQASSLPYEPVSTAEADLLLGLHSTFSAPSTASSVSKSTHLQVHTTNEFGQIPISHTIQQRLPNNRSPIQTSTILQSTDVLVDSRDIDMLNPKNQPIVSNVPRGDMIPWLEYLPLEVLNYFGNPDELNLPNAFSSSPPHENTVLPTGPGPPHYPFDRDHDGQDSPETTRHHFKR